jgi:L-lactate dehydrogenase complex protein LldG
MNTVRNTILERLSNTGGNDLSTLPELAPFPHLSLDQVGLLESLARALAEQGAEVYQPEGFDDMVKKVTAFMDENHIQSIMASDDPLIGRMLLGDGSLNVRKVFRLSDFSDEKHYKETAFTVDAGLTHVDFAVAESGTLVIKHHKGNPRLISLAPPVHMAVVCKESIVPVYEIAMNRISGKESLPSQITLITGPSMTADIMANPFRGMHGPKRLAVFIL